MRLNINLAREPFRNDRPMYVGAAILSTILLAGLAVNLLGIFAERDRVAGLRTRAENLRLEVEKLNKQEVAMRTGLSRGDNSLVFQRSVFLNSLILPKSMSWTRMLGDLEKVLPQNTRVLSVRQQINDRNQILLDMIVAAESADPVVAMLKRMENSAQFSRTQVSTITPPGQSDNTFKYRVTVTYEQQL